MNILSHLFPQIIYKTTSSFNKRIEVREFQGVRSLLVNGILQTGPYDTKIFDRAFDTFLISTYPIKNTLVLGVGGGYVIKKIQLLFPDIKVTGVDIDSEIIDIAQSYFGLKHDENLSLVVADAKEFVIKKSQQYDCIIIDLYIGDDIPEFFSEETFFKAIHNLLSKGGIVVINYQGIDSYKDQRQKLILLLNQIFPSEQHVQIQRNVFFLLRH